MTAEVLDYEAVYANIADHIMGRIAIQEDEAILLAETVAQSAVHVEVGCMWGGTAILAALAGAKLTYTIDSLGANLWKTYDPMVGKKPTTDIVIGNFRRFGVYEWIKFVIAKSDPFPILGLEPDTFFIDGDHSFGGCLADWRNAVKMTKRAILVHDYDPIHAGVKRVIDEIALKEPGWELAERVQSMLLFERANE